MILKNKFRNFLNIFQKQKLFNSFSSLSELEADDEDLKKKKGKVDPKDLYLLQQYKLKNLRNAKTNDNYRLDVGLIISRPPIFLTFTEEEMDNIKFRHEFHKKYNLYFKISDDLMNFSKRAPNYGYDFANLDNLMTHRKVVSPKKTITYGMNSKMFKLADPNMKDPRHIQYEGCMRVYFIVKDKSSQEWIFPERPILEKESVKDAKENLFELISQEKWSVYHVGNIPVVCNRRDLYEHELKSSRNNKFIGAKCFYFYANHVKGPIHYNPELYDDFVWVTRFELGKYFTKEKYEKFIHSMHLF